MANSRTDRLASNKFDPLRGTIFGTTMYVATLCTPYISVHTKLYFRLTVKVAREPEINF